MSTPAQPLIPISDEHLLVTLGVEPSIAARAIAAAGDIRNLLAIPPDRIEDRTGLPRALYARLHAARELGRRDLAGSLERGQTLNAKAATNLYVLANSRDLPYESVRIIWLDTKHRVITCEELFRGTIDAARIYPREIVRRGIELNAAASLLLHNHVSGDPTPSDADRTITERLVNILASVRIQILDHLIVGDGQVSSFAELGILPTPDPRTLL